MKPIARFEFLASPAQGSNAALARAVLAVFESLRPSGRLAGVLLYAAEFNVYEAAATSGCTPLEVLEFRQRVRAAALQSWRGNEDPNQLDRRIRDALSEVCPVPPGLEQRVLRCIAESCQETPSVRSVSPRDGSRRW